MLKVKFLPLMFAFAVHPLLTAIVRAEDVSPADLKAWEQHALTNRGDAKRGRTIFLSTKTKCATCHHVASIGLSGQKGRADVGPDLSSIGGKFDRPHLIESLLEPSRQIVEGYRTHILVLDNGTTASGLVKSESATHVELIDADSKRRSIPLASIEARRISKTSLMPTGLAAALTREEFTDLIAFLESLRRGRIKMGGSVDGPIQLPDGFQVETVVTGLTGCTALEILPDGRILICEQTGSVRMVKNDELLPEPCLTLPVDSSWERGVIGITHHPVHDNDPTASNWIYVCWIAKDPYPHHCVSRFRFVNDRLDPASEQRLLEGDDQNTLGGKVKNGHQGGALHFGSDGKLYIAIGEQTAGKPAQNLTTLLGKMLRINPDGSIPSDNPLVDSTTGKYQAIWARGLRNPFTFAVRKTDGLMLINDVGGKFEEINIGRSGANYGWPVVNHGPVTSDDRFTGPIHWYPESSINGGDFCPPTSNWPQEYHGRYIFGDYKQGWLRSLNPDRISKVREFAGNIRRPVDLRFAPNGDLYVLLRNAWVIDGKFQNKTGSLLRIRWENETANR